MSKENRHADIEFDDPYWDTSESSIEDNIQFDDPYYRDTSESSEEGNDEKERWNRRPEKELIGDRALLPDEAASKTDTNASAVGGRKNATSYERSGEDDKNKKRENYVPTKRLDLKNKLQNILTTNHGKTFYDREGPTPISVYVKQIADEGKVKWFIQLIENGNSKSKELIDDANLWKVVLLLSQSPYLAGLNMSKAKDYDYELIPSEEYVAAELYRSLFRYSSKKFTKDNMWFYYLKYIMTMEKKEVLEDGKGGSVSGRSGGKSSGYGRGELDGGGKNPTKTERRKKGKESSEYDGTLITGKTFYDVNVSYLNPPPSYSVCELILNSPLWSHGDLFSEGFVSNVTNLGVNASGIATVARRGRHFGRFNVVTGKDVYAEDLSLPLHSDFFDYGAPARNRVMECGSSSLNKKYEQAWNYNIVFARTKRDVIKRLNRTKSILKKWYKKGTVIRTKRGCYEGCEEMMKREMKARCDRLSASSSCSPSKKPCSRIKSEEYDAYYDACVMKKYKRDKAYFEKYSSVKDAYGKSGGKDGRRNDKQRQRKTKDGNSFNKPRTTNDGTEDYDSFVNKISNGTLLDVLAEEVRNGRGKHTAHFHVMENGDVLVIFEDYKENISVVLYAFEEKSFKTVNCVTLLKINLKDLERSFYKTERYSDGSATVNGDYDVDSSVTIASEISNTSKRDKKASIRSGGGTASVSVGTSSAVDRTDPSLTTSDMKIPGGKSNPLLSESNLPKNTFFNVRNYSTSQPGIPKSKCIDRIISGIRYSHSSSSSGSMSVVSFAFLVNVHHYVGSPLEGMRDKTFDGKSRRDYDDGRYSEDFYYPYVDEDDDNVNVLRTDEIISMSVFFSGSDVTDSEKLGVSATCVSREHVSGRFTSEKQRMIAPNSFDSPGKKMRIDCLNGEMEGCCTVYVLSLVDTDDVRSEDTLILKWTEGLPSDSDSSASNGNSTLQSYLLPGQKSPGGTMVLGTLQSTGYWGDADLKYTRHEMLLRYNTNYYTESKESQRFHTLGLMNVKYPYNGKEMFKTEHDVEEEISALNFRWDKTWVVDSMLFGLAPTNEGKTRIHVMKMNTMERDSLILLNRSTIDGFDFIDYESDHYYRTQLLGAAFKTMTNYELLIVKEQLNEHTFKGTTDDLTNPPTIRLFCCRYPKIWQMEKSKDISIESSITYSTDLDRVCTHCEKDGCTNLEKKDSPIGNGDSEEPEKWYFCDKKCYDDFYDELNGGTSSVARGNRV